jgi:succinoglycan biosynthesis transport protein ExoP
VASHSYDQIIVDAPPLLGLADAPIIATAVDGTMLVIEAGRGRIGAVRGALKRLMAVRARIVGTALVKYDAKAAGFAYGYGYGYGGSEYYYYNHSDAAEGGSRKRRRLSRA